VRAGRLLKLGAPVAWVIWPERRQVWEYRPGDLNEKSDSLLGELATDIEAIRVPLPAVWAAMTRF
jgi:hypothetical protein